MTTARISQILAEGLPRIPPRPPVSGIPCSVPECQADTRRGTLDGGAPMLCGGHGMPGEPCVAVWLTEDPDERGDYRSFVRAYRKK